MKQHICWCCIYIYTFNNKSRSCCLHFKFALCWRWIEQRPSNLPLKYPLPMHSSTVHTAALHAATTIKTNKLLWTEFALFWSPEVPQTQKCSLVVVEQSQGEEPRRPGSRPLLVLGRVALVVVTTDETRKLSTAVALRRQLSDGTAPLPSPLGLSQT